MMRTRTWMACLAALIAVGGCSGYDAGASVPGADGGAAADAAIGPDGGGAADGAAQGDAGVGPLGLPANFDSAGLVGEGSSTVAASCYDGTDDDLSGAADCADPTCQPLRACCIGAGDCCADATEPALPPSVDFGGCDAAAGVDGCLASQGVVGTRFGTPSPELVAGGLAPGGDASFDSGVVLGEPVDLRTRRVSVRATILPAAGCGASCLEGAGVALTTQGTFDDATEVTPRVGLVYGGSDGRVRLVIAGAEVASAPLPADGEVRFVVEPTGVVRAFAGAATATPFAETRVAPTPGAHLVVFGRNRDATADTGARVAAIGVDEQVCDMPTAWASRTALTIVDPATGSAADLGPIGGPSLAYDGDGVAWLVFAEARDAGASVIRWARRRDGTRTVFDLVDSGATPALAPNGATEEAAVGDPELVWDPGIARWVLLYTTVATDGRRAIGRAEADAGATAFTADPVPVLAPNPTAGVDAVQAPTVARRADGVWAVVVQVDGPAGTRLRAYLSSDTDAGRTPLPLPGAPSVDPAQVPGGTAFDGDGVSDPSLVRHGGTWRLLYARTRGTRRAVGELASDELLYYRQVDDGAPILDATGSGFDALGAASPDAVPLPDALEVVYLGFDGVTFTPAIAWRESPDDGMF